MTEFTILSARIKADISEIDKVVNRTAILSMKALKSEDDGYWDGVALNLHNFYSGVERIFEDIARTFDKGIPSGPDWHVGLLIQMSTEVTNQRPPIISNELRFMLDEYRGFRHVIRNVYAFNLRPGRVKELADGLTGCYDLVKHELLKFAQFLETLN